MTKITNFVWNPVDDCIISELDGTGTVQAVYTNEPQQYGGVISQRRGTTTSTHHYDALGSTRFLTDSSGNVTDTYLHDAWGNSVASTGTTVNPFRWVGKYGYYTDDNTGLVYVRARMYQSTMARWMSIDPIYFEDYRNEVFRYARNSPLVRIDPTGLICEDPTAMPFVAGRGEFTDVVFRGTTGRPPGEPGKWQSIFSLEWKSNIGAFNSTADNKPCCCCDRLGMVQITRSSKDRGIAWHWETDWYLDAAVPYPTGLPKDLRNDSPKNLSTSGSPCGKNSLTLGMFDAPGIWPDPWGPLSNGLERYRQKFETCVVCLSGLEGPSNGNSVGAIYGCLTWEHEFRHQAKGDEVKRRLLSHVKGFGLLSKDQVDPSFWDVGFGRTETGAATHAPTGFFRDVMSKGNARDYWFEYWYK
jgi:RHS repeat-associated protein